MENREQGAGTAAREPRVTVIVPVYNAGGYLTQCLESLAAQAMPADELEVLLVDDGSTDGSGEVLAAFAAGHPNMRVLSKPNGGYGSAMNLGLDNARGAYIGIVEPDDYVDSRMFPSLLALADGIEPPLDVVKGAYWRVVRDGGRERAFPCRYKGRFAPESQPFSFAQCGPLLYSHPSIWSAIYRRGFLEEKGIRFQELPGAGWADNLFLYKTLGLAGSIAYLDACLYYYREETIDGSSRLRDYALPLDRWDELQDFIEEQGIDDPALLEPHAYRGFSYIGYARAALNAGECAEELEERVRSMYARMDESAVLACPKLGRDDKLAYLAVVDPGYEGEVTGLGTADLAREFVDEVVHGGPGAAAYMVRYYLSKH